MGSLILALVLFLYVVVPHSALTLGNQTFINGVSVHGAIIMSDYDNARGTPPSSVKSSPNATQTTMEAKIMARGVHARQFMSAMPFAVVEWPPVFTKECPNRPHQHHKKRHHGATERGLALAHYQIWLDFIYFDHDVLKELNKTKVDYTSTDYSSVSSQFMLATNGILYKDSIAFLDNDIIVIFEDDVDIAVQDVVWSLHQELSDMHVDLLFLGWCEGRLARPVPLCSHAYAATRHGVRKLVKHFEPCGRALDEQFVIMGKNKWISYRSAHKSSYDKYNERYPLGNDKTKGLFHQLKTLGSLNGH